MTTTNQKLSILVDSVGFFFIFYAIYVLLSYEFQESFMAFLLGFTFFGIEIYLFIRDNKLQEIRN